MKTTTNMKTISNMKTSSNRPNQTKAAKPNTPKQMYQTKYNKPNIKKIEPTKQNPPNQIISNQNYQNQ